MKRYPFFVLLMSLIAGILIGDLVGGLWLPLGVMFTALTIYGILLVLSKDPMRTMQVRRYHVVWVVMFFIGFGMMVKYIGSPTIKDCKSAVLPEYVRARIEQKQTKDYGDRMIVGIEAFESAEGGVSVPVRNVKAVLTTDGIMASEGDVVRFPRELKAIDDKKGMTPEYASYIEGIKRQNVLYRQYCKAENIEVAEGKGLSVFLNRVRENIAIKIDKSSLSNRCRRLLNTCLLGLKDDIYPEEREMFADAGISHVLALSGLHVGIVSGIILFLLMPLNAVGQRRLRYFIAIACLWVFTMITGMVPSAVRASVMLSFCLMAAALERKNVSLNALCAAVFLILLFDPTALYSIGLQLSAVTVACILVFVDKLVPEKLQHHRWAGKILPAIAVSIVAVLGSWALTAWYFNTFSPSFLLVNLIVVPLMGPYIALGLLHIVLLAIGIDFSALTWLMSAISEVIAWIAGQGATMSPAVTVSISWITLAMWMLAISLAIVWIKGKRNWALWISSGVAVMAIVSIWVVPGEVTTGYYIDNDGRNITVSIYDYGEKRVKKIPQRAITVCQAHGDRLLYIDKGLPKDKDIRLDCEVVIIGVGYRGKLEDLMQRFSPRMVLISKGVYKAKKESLRREGARKGIKLHSLGEEGGYFMDISDKK